MIKALQRRYHNERTRRRLNVTRLRTKLYLLCTVAFNVFNRFFLLLSGWLVFMNPLKMPKKSGGCTKHSVTNTARQRRIFTLCIFYNFSWLFSFFIVVIVILHFIYKGPRYCFMFVLLHHSHYRLQAVTLFYYSREYLCWRRTC